MGIWHDSGRYLMCTLCSERKELQPDAKQGEPREDWWRGRSMMEIVPDTLQGFKVCGKLCTAILLLLQLPPECTQLLLSLHLDVVGHHHCCLEIRLEPTPLFFFILKTHGYVLYW